MVTQNEERQDEYDDIKDVDLHKHEIADSKDEAQHAIFSKG